MGLLNACVEVARYLNSVKKVARIIESELNGLLGEIEALEQIHTVIQDIREKTNATVSPTRTEGPEVSRLWEKIQADADRCTSIIIKLPKEVSCIMGIQEAKPRSQAHEFKKILNMQSSRPKLSRFHEELSKYHRCFQVCLTALDL